MIHIKTGLLVFFVCAFGYFSNAQVNEGTTISGVESKPFILKPSVEIGAGVFSFFGDVANAEKTGQIGESRMGYHIKIKTELSKSLDLSFGSVWGTLSANERGDRNLNFKSRIRTGGIGLTYKFYELLPSIYEKRINPHLSIGIESFEFLSKTDLYDSKGQFYYYWDDGSIRNMAQNSRGSFSSELLTRDYSYETDLRELNADGFEKYQERSWAIPISIGVDFHVTKKFHIDWSTSYYFTGTDLVDNVTSKSIDIRQGNAGNDKFWYTSVGIRYLFNWEFKEEEPTDLLGDEFYVDTDTFDIDRDGVVDINDDCSMTKLGVDVKLNGCPFDDDFDLVFDYEDEELFSDSGSVVTLKGVQLTDQWTKNEYDKFLGKPGEFNEIVTEFRDGRIKDISPKPNKQSFVVVIGDEKKNIKSYELSKYLSHQDFQEIKRNDTTYYVLGAYEDLEDAVAAKKSLGIENATVVDLAKVNDEELKSIRIPKEKEQRYLNKVKKEQVKETFYRVQVGAFSNELSENVFKDLPELLHLRNEDGLTRYYSGTFTDFETALNRKYSVINLGFEAAFIVAFKKGNKVPIAETGIRLAKNVVPIEKPKKINPSRVSYSIQIGAFVNQVPPEILDVYFKIGNVYGIQGDDGMTRYYHGKFTSVQDATGLLDSIKKKGVTDAFVVGKFNRNIITSEEAQKLLEH